MRTVNYKSLLLFVLSIAMIGQLAVSQAKADGLYGIPDFQTMHPGNTLQDMVLGSSCISMPSSPLELSCNPAMLAVETKRQVRFDVSANDKVGTVYNYSRYLGNNDTIGLVNGLLSEKEPLIANAATSAWYQRDNWAIGATPLRAGYASYYRNDAYPELAGSVYAEKEVFAKYGYQLPSDPALRLGVQTRYVERDYFNKSFDLLDAAIDNSVIAANHEKVLYVEPGVSYALNEKGSYLLSAMMSNLSVYRTGDVQSVRPVFDIGLMEAPEFAGGRLKTSTHFSNNPDVANPWELFSQGVIYDFEKYVSLSGSLGAKTAGIGIQGHIDSLVLGLGYKSEQVDLDQWQTVRISTWLFETGLKF